MKIHALPALLLGLAVLSATAQEAAPPAASDDPYRALEEAALPETQAFFREQARDARERLDRIPGRAAMLARVRELADSGTSITALAVTAGPRIFYLKLAPRSLTPVLCMRESIAGAEHVLVDPARFTRDANHAAIDWFSAAPDGRHVAYGVSLAGSESSVLRVIAVDGARDLPFEIDRTRFNDNLGWHSDARSFYYARIPETSSGLKRYANVRVYRHVLGRDTSHDEIVFAPGVGGARDVPESVRPSIVVPLESRYAYAIARDGVRNEIAVHASEARDLAAGKPRWHKLVGHDDEVVAIEGWKDDLYLLTHRGAPRYRVLRAKGGARDLSDAKVVVPQGDTVIKGMALARDALYLRTMVGGVDRLERVQLGFLGAKAPEYVRTPFDNAIAQLVAHPRTDGALLRLQGWVEPPAVMKIDAKGNISNTRLAPPQTADFSAMDEVRLYAPAHDGTKIPVTLIYQKNTTLTGGNPTLLTAYGSYGVTLSPTFDPARLAWLERGGIFAIAHVRGGGEYGEPWHQGGRRASKINTILDFISVSEFLVSYGFTSPRRLAILGTSAGGIPAGGAMVRRPDLYAAVVARVPVLDMVRFESMASGPANVPEFGSAATPQGLEALRVMSAYHHVKDGTAYPAMLLTAGINDPRVEAWQPGKMAARVQKATTSGKPVLLRIDYDSGHGPGTQRAQRDAELADIYSFLLWQMGDPAFQPAIEPAPAPAEPPAAEAPKGAP
jgi:prolyl oligopeptidase